MVTACVHFAVSTTVAFGDVNCLYNCGEMCNPWHFCDIFKRKKFKVYTTHAHTGKIKKRNTDCNRASLITI